MERSAHLENSASEEEISERERIAQELRDSAGHPAASLPKEVPWRDGASPFYQASRRRRRLLRLLRPRRGRVGVVVGDATGKGMPAALAEATSNMLQGGSPSLGLLPPREVLSRVNETLLARIPPNMFVTCFYAILDLKSGV